MVNMVDVGIEASGEKPVGADFKVFLAGKDVWFRNLTEGQGIVLSKVMRRTQRLIDDVHASDLPVRDKVSEVGQLLNIMYQRMWDAIDVTIVFEDDVAFLEEAMLTRRLDIAEAMIIFSRGVPDPEPDDAEIVAAPQPRKLARKALPKKSANAQRTQL